LDDTGHVLASLRDIARDYGAFGLDDTAMLDRLLSDLLAGYPREARLVLAAASAGTARLLADRIGQGLPLDAAVRDVAAHLATEAPVDASACHWIVAAYAQALGYSNAPPANAPPANAPTVEPATVRTGPPRTMLLPDAESPANAQPEPPPWGSGRPTPSPAPPIQPHAAALIATTTPRSKPSWQRRYAIPGATLAAANLVTVLLVARAEVSVGSRFGLAALWWLCAFAPVSVAVIVRSRQRTDRTWRDTASALLAIAVSAVVIVQAADPHRHYIHGLGLAVSDGAAIAALGYAWYDRAESRPGRLAGAVIVGVATWLIQRSATATLQFPSTDHWLRTVVQGLLIPALLVASSVVSWLATSLRRSA